MGDLLRGGSVCGALWLGGRRRHPPRSPVAAAGELHRHRRWHGVPVCRRTVPTRPDSIVRHPVQVIQDHPAAPEPAPAGAAGAGPGSPTSIMLDSDGP